MSPIVVATGAGLQRGWIEFRRSLTNAGEFVGWVWPSIVAVIVLFIMRDNTVPGTEFSLGAQSIPGLLGLNVVLTGMMGMAMELTMGRQDGTLLRMKATPNGIVGYLVGKVVSMTAVTVAVLLIVLVPAVFLFDGIEPSLATLAAVLVLGLLATLPVGAVIGSLFTSARNAGLVTMLVLALSAISGVFYPITALPDWLQWIGQAFPVYWLGLGMRSALLPDAVAVAEIGESWRHLETVAVLGLWAVVGFALAPIVLRWMARRESGSRVAARKEKALQQAI